MHIDLPVDIEDRRRRFGHGVDADLLGGRQTHLAKGCVVFQHRTGIRRGVAGQRRVQHAHRQAALRKQIAAEFFGVAIVGIEHVGDIVRQCAPLQPQQGNRHVHRIGLAGHRKLLGVAQVYPAAAVGNQGGGLLRADLAQQRRADQAQEIVIGNPHQRAGGQHADVCAPQPFADERIVAERVTRHLHRQAIAPAVGIGAPDFRGARLDDVIAFGWPVLLEHEFTGRHGDLVEPREDLLDIAGRHVGQRAETQRTLEAVHLVPVFEVLDFRATVRRGGGRETQLTGVDRVRDSQQRRRAHRGEFDQVAILVDRVRHRRTVGVVAQGLSVRALRSDRAMQQEQHIRRSICTHHVHPGAVVLHFGSADQRLQIFARQVGQWFETGNRRRHVLHPLLAPGSQGAIGRVECVRSLGHLTLHSLSVCLSQPALYGPPNLTTGPGARFAVPDHLFTQLAPDADCRQEVLQPVAAAVPPALAHRRH